MWVTLGKLFHFSEPQFLHLWNWENKTYLKGLSEWLDAIDEETCPVPHVEQKRALDKITSANNIGYIIKLSVMEQSNLTCTLFLLSLITKKYVEHIQSIQMLDQCKEWRWWIGQWHSCITKAKRPMHWPSGWQAKLWRRSWIEVTTTRCRVGQLRWQLSPCDIAISGCGIEPVANNY